MGRIDTMNLKKIIWKEGKWINSQRKEVKPKAIGESELISIVDDKNKKWNFDKK